MSKKKDDNQVTLYASNNGWLKVFYKDGTNKIYKPDFQSFVDDTPTTWHYVGMFNEMQDTTNTIKGE
jgi:hypothetical protein